MVVSALGAVIGLALAIVLIIKKHNPAYSLILGALVGGLAGGANLPETVSLMVAGAKGITPAVLRIITAGVLAGVLIESGAAGKIAETIIEKLGEKKALLALALATMILTGVGVFVDVAVITVSPIALAIGKRLNLSKLSILLAMIGGGKSGNIISPNPNTIAASQNFGVELSSLMGANIVPAIFGLIITCFLAKSLIEKGEKVSESDEHEIEKDLPSFATAIIGPIVTIVLLALRPLAGISVDPLIALPMGGIIGCIAMGKRAHLKTYMQYGLSKMTGVAILLMGTGTVAGIIKNSTLKDVTLSLIEKSGLPEFILAPASGALMSAATASTTAGTTVASATFGAAITAAGIKALYGAAMVHAGATVLDHLPHGSFFHATAGCTNTRLEERFKLLPYETAVGFTLALVSTIIYGVIL
jgi:GntP family gluconate:H+ symporter